MIVEDATAPLDDDARLVTVCDKCLRACCWHGIFYCDDYRGAGTVDMSINDLATLDREHPSYWAKDYDGR